jgi:hypothetical protein
MDIEQIELRTFSNARFRIEAATLTGTLGTTAITDARITGMLVSQFLGDLAATSGDPCGSGWTCSPCPLSTHMCAPLDVSITSIPLQSVPAYTPRTQADVQAVPFCSF